MGLSNRQLINASIADGYLSEIKGWNLTASTVARHLLNGDRWLFPMNHVLCSIGQMDGWMCIRHKMSEKNHSATTGRRVQAGGGSLMVRRMFLWQSEWINESMGLSLQTMSTLTCGLYFFCTMTSSIPVRQHNVSYRSQCLYVVQRAPG